MNDAAYNASSDVQRLVQTASTKALSSEDERQDAKESTWMELIAHTTDDGRVQSLKEHSCHVSEMAGSFAEPFGGRKWAQLVGAVHDAGKASAAFQRRIRGSAEQVDHSSAGAQILANRYGLPGKMLSYACAGHHGGMPNYAEDDLGRTSLVKRLEKDVEDYEEFEREVDLPGIDDVCSTESLPTGLALSVGDQLRLPFACYLAIHMIYSSLVDADYLDTERFVRPDLAARRRPTSSASELGKKLADEVRKIEKAANPSPINTARREMRLRCLKRANDPTGIFALTMPTGAGKTLTSMSFALEHAAANGQQRVIFAIPFTSIVEQTAEVLRSIFGRENVLEHHSGYRQQEDEESEIARSLATENWDAPVVVTTNVQLFESIYAAKPGRARKAHNIANSVIVIDEAQALPDAQLSPCLGALEELSRAYNTTTVLCSATQPELGATWPFGTTPKRLLSDDETNAPLFSRRREIRNIGEVSLEALASKIADESQALCILSTRRGAATLFDKVAEMKGEDGCYHLSAFMTPDHRKVTLREVKGRLRKGLPCTLISTQVIEAGVDIDFPYVLREMAGLDSIVQAAGRCNREGKAKKAHVDVFDCPDLKAKARGWLGNMRGLAEEVVRESDDPFGEEGISEFFQKRYQVADTDVNGVFAEAGDIKRMRDARWDFARHDREFAIIDDAGEPVFIPWGEHGAELLARMRSGDTPLSCEVQPCTINMPKYVLDELEGKGVLAEMGPYTAIDCDLTLGEYYDDKKGLVTTKQGTGIFI